jgi:hypothetical protein
MQYNGTMVRRNSCNTVVLKVQSQTDAKRVNGELDLVDISCVLHERSVGKFTSKVGMEIIFNH